MVLKFLLKNKVFLTLLKLSVGIDFLSSPQKRQLGRSVYSNGAVCICSSKRLFGLSPVSQDAICMYVNINSGVRIKFSSGR